MNIEPTGHDSLPTPTELTKDTLDDERPAERPIIESHTEHHEATPLYLNPFA